MLGLSFLKECWTIGHREFYNATIPDDSSKEKFLMEETEITFHAVEKDGVVTAIWEMKGRVHLRTIDPRSEEGRQILSSYTADDLPEQANTQAAGQSESQ